MMKRYIPILMIASIAYASNITSNAKTERGWRFGDFKDENATKKEPKTQKEILKKILSVQEEQLDVQKNILKVLQKRFDPQPETIIVNGKPCIANSSAECYKWVPEPEAKRYPIIQQFYSNPTIENAARYIKWYSKHTNNARKGGIALMMAKYQYGDNAADFNSKKNGMFGGFGEIKEAKRRHNIKVLQKNSDKFYMNLYLGRGLDVDLFGTRGLAYLFEKLPKVTINIIYYNDDVKKKLYMLSKEYDNLKYVLGKGPEFVDKKMFKEHGIYSTPTLEIVLKKKKNVHQIIGTGNITAGSSIARAIDYLWIKKIIKSNNYASDYKVWDDSHYFEDTSYEETDKVLDKNKYKYENTDMKPRKVPKALTK